MLGKESVPELTTQCMYTSSLWCIEHEQCTYMYINVIKATPMGMGLFPAGKDSILKLDTRYWYYGIFQRKQSN